MARRMADVSFQREQWEHRYEPHIAPINEIVDSLRSGDYPASESRWAPYVAPMYGGIHAQLLSVLRDPGPKTRDGQGSGFLCMENDDPTAEAICGFFASAGIEASDIVPWNAYPWYINRAPQAAELEAGIEPWMEVMEQMPKLRVVMLHGGSAHNGWKRLMRRYPRFIAQRKLHVIATYHTSRQAFWHADPAVREARQQHLHNAFIQAARYLKPDR